MTVSKNLGGAFLEEGQTGAETALNDFLARLDTFTPLLLLDRGVNTPIVSPDNGDAYLIGSSPTGAWASYADHLAFYMDGWNYIDPSAGDGLPVIAHVADEDIYIAYNPTEDLWHPLQEYHSTSEEWTGRYDRNGNKIYCKTVNVGSLPNADTDNTVHSISGLNKCIVMRGFADNGTLQIPLPYYKSSGGVELHVTDSNVVIITTTDMSGYSGDVYLEYTKA